MERLSYILAGRFAGNLLAVYFADFFKIAIFGCLLTALPLQNVGSLGVLICPLWSGKSTSGPSVILATT